jgi:hypothetical protein
VAQGPHARSERYASGGLAVVIGLDDGPALRVPAAEPLAGRDSGSPSRLGGGHTGVISYRLAYGRDGRPGRGATSGSFGTSSLPRARQ